MSEQNREPDDPLNTLWVARNKVPLPARFLIGFIFSLFQAYVFTLFLENSPQIFAALFGASMALQIIVLLLLFVVATYIFGSIHRAIEKTIEESSDENSTKKDGGTESSGRGNHQIQRRELTPAEVLTIAEIVENRIKDRHTNQSVTESDFDDLVSRVENLEESNPETAAEELESQISDLRKESTSVYEFEERFRELEEASDKNRNYIRTIFEAIRDDYDDLSSDGENTGSSANSEREDSIGKKAKEETNQVGTKDRDDDRELELE